MLDDRLDLVFVVDHILTDICIFLSALAFSSFHKGSFDR